MSDGDAKPRKRRRRFGSLEEAECASNPKSDIFAISDVRVPDGDTESESQSKGAASKWAGCRSVENYERLNFIGEGTYGRVYRARELQTGKIYALKQLKVTEERNGFPVTCLREVSSLFRVCHPNVVSLKEVVVGKGIRNVYMVLEYASHDVCSILDRMKRPYSSSEIKSLLLQILQGVEHLHANWIIHRDLKPANLLLNDEGIVKICDLGLARNISPHDGSRSSNLTPGVTTLWYRAPEILMSDPKYTTAVDMWAVGCIFAELVLRKPLLQGSGELDQLRHMCELLGAPAENVWENFNELPHATKLTFPHKLKRSIRDTLVVGDNKEGKKKAYLSPAGVDLVEKMLTYDPKRRITAEDAIEHEYFKEVPPPKDPALIQTFPDDRRG